ncbi:sarcosine oxidase subunit gamma [Azospirillum lipoferum]|nr:MULTISPECIES: sarcosine oxidase subunit gamma family protein [Azospirillum]MCP1611472.1 sarcosine oxidase subunit gamma [Azospirillum lipoferum]MDW5537274.1 sarcosine oxidase subunit gamma family protein [Azospirillum sp. NL1]
MPDAPYVQAPALITEDRITGAWETVPTGKILLRGDPADRLFHRVVTQALGAGPPTEPNRVQTARSGPIVWFGPDEWLAEVPDGDCGRRLEELRRGLAGTHAAAVDVSDCHVVFRLSGARARDVLAKTCPLDLRPRSFGPGDCARSRLGQASVCVILADPSPVFRIFVPRSIADYAGQLLFTGMEEFAAPPAGRG